MTHTKRKWPHFSRVMMILMLSVLYNYIIGQDNPVEFNCEAGYISVKIKNEKNNPQVAQVLQKLGTTLEQSDSIWGLIKEKRTHSGWELVDFNTSVIQYRKLLKEFSAEGINDFLVFDQDRNAEQLPYDLSVEYGVNNFSKKSVAEFDKELTTFNLFGYPNAKKVYLAGTFNDWSLSTTPMKKVFDGWSVKIPLTAGKHLYKFIVDGIWKTDPSNKQKEYDRNQNLNSVYFKTNHVFKFYDLGNSQKVYLVGSFNNWKTKQLRMIKGDYGWQLPIYLKNGIHTYKFYSKGKYFLDPSNSEVRQDGMGNNNSLLIIGEPHNFEIKGFQGAKKVVLSGEFNKWNGAELTMTKTDNGWSIPISLDPGNYAYKFVVDGKWKTDPSNPHQIGSGNLTNSVYAFQTNHTFILNEYASAKQVILSGTFNNWSEDGYTMQKVGNTWQMSLYLPKGKTRYKFIVDGKWMIDPENELWENNRYGTKDSILWK